MITFNRIKEGLMTWKPSGRLATYAKRYTLFQDQDGKNVMMFTEQGETSGPSVTNAIEDLAIAAMREFPDLTMANTIWIEHYTSEARGGDEETFDVVTFRDGRAVWTHTTRDELEKSLGVRMG